MHIGQGDTHFQRRDLGVDASGVGFILLSDCILPPAAQFLPLETFRDFEGVAKLGGSELQFVSHAALFNTGVTVALNVVCITLSLGHGGFGKSRI